MIFFLIAAYNEKENIPALFSAIRSFYPEGNGAKVILVDDGSTDGTAEEAREIMPSAVIISHEKNVGLGAALKTGFVWIFNEIKPDNFLITLDADNTHPIPLTREMIVKLGAADIVVASRYVKGAEEIGLSKMRKILSTVANEILRILFPSTGLTDYTSGFRAFRGDFLLKLSEKYGAGLVTEKGFTATAEILLKSLALKPIIAEVPLILRYDLRKGKSKMKVLRTVLSYFFLTFRLKFGS